MRAEPVEELDHRLVPRATFTQVAIGTVRTRATTRITRLGPRKGDGAEQAMLELVGSELVKRAADRAQRREERLKAQREGRDTEQQGEE